MPFKDLRAFIERLREEGELAVIEEEVDWNLEIGALTRLGLDHKGPALLFERIRGYPPDRRVAGNLVGPTRPVVQGRVALAMDLPKDTPTEDLIAEFRRRSRDRVPPTIVADAPCKRNVVAGPEVDLLEFPVPLVHEGDGGRMIGTWHLTITRDPDTGWVNWGTYRHQLLSSNTVGWLAHPGQHGPWQYYQKFEARGEAMPIAIAIGTEPMSNILAASQMPPGVSEVEVVGAIRREPVELVKCETSDLLVPAGAEIVLEGEVLPHERAFEGGFGEYTGYFAGERMERPVIRIRCITYRDGPILTVSNPGKPWDEYHVLSSVTMSAELANHLEANGIPFRAVYVPAPAMSIIVATEPRYAGFVHTVASAVWASKAGLYRPYLYVVGEDIDPTNLEEVFWCLNTRLHPQRGIHVFHDAPSQPLFPFVDHEEREKRLGARVAFDATFPWEWPPEQVPRINDFTHAWPPEVQAAASDKWARWVHRPGASQA